MIFPLLLNYELHKMMILRFQIIFGENLQWNQI